MSKLDELIALPGQPLHDRGGWQLGTWTDPEGVEWYIDALPMLYNLRITTGHAGNPYGWEYGWCYRKDWLVLISAFRVWDLTVDDEPIGWHKRATPSSRVRRAPERVAGTPLRCPHGVWPGEPCQPGCEL